jgi:hypothetical protein
MKLSLVCLVAKRRAWRAPATSRRHGNFERARDRAGACRSNVDTHRSHNAYVLLRSVGEREVVSEPRGGRTGIVGREQLVYPSSSLWVR